VVDSGTFEHDELVEVAKSNILLCYSDGSASPNPGPCGAGASIFLANPDSLFDFGFSLGRATNNFAELYALGIVLTEIVKLRRVHPCIDTAVIFSDSKLALNAATSRKIPLTNGPITRALRKVFEFAVSVGISVNLHWIRGHSSIGGNERVDRLSKRYAAVSGNDKLIPFDGLFISHGATSSWFPGFPLSSLPVDVFKLNLPIPFVPVAPPVVTHIPVSTIRAVGSRSSARLAALIHN